MTVTLIKVKIKTKLWVFLLLAFFCIHAKFCQCSWKIVGEVDGIGKAKFCWATDRVLVMVEATVVFVKLDPVCGVSGVRGSFVATLFTGGEGKRFFIRTK